MEIRGDAQNCIFYEIKIDFGQYKKKKKKKKKEENTKNICCDSYEASDDN